MPLSTEKVLSIEGLEGPASGEASLLLDGMIMLKSSSLTDTVSSEKMTLPSLLVGRERGRTLGDVPVCFGDGMPDLGEALIELTAGLPASSFLREADAATDLARFTAVSCRGLCAGLLLEGVSGRISRLDAHGSAVAGLGISGFLTGRRAAPDIKEFGRDAELEPDAASVEGAVEDALEAIRDALVVLVDGCRAVRLAVDLERTGE